MCDLGISTYRIGEQRKLACQTLLLAKYVSIDVLRLLRKCDKYQALI